VANRKITSLVALAAPAIDDVLPIIDISETGNDLKNKKITYGELFKSLPDGSNTAPAIAFNSSTSTGLYRSAANELSIATNGGQAIKIEADNKTTIYGDLVVTGSQTTVSSTTITVADKNIELATGNSSDAGADGGGLTLKGASDKTWNWIDSTDAWTANQHVDVASGKVYKIAGATVLNATTLGSAVVNSSLTSVGTLGSLTVTNAVTAGSLDISGGADIDGTLEADAYTVNGTALNEYIADTVGAMVSSNTETNITVTYQDADNTLDFVIGTLNQDTTGNAATATALETARTIGGVSFNGTANINLPGVNQTGNQNTTGSAATLTTARMIGGVSFDGSANINLPGVNAAGNQNTSGTAAGLSGTPNITVADVIAASLDISGNADIDGTLEADAITVNGTALNEFIADTVGAMVSSNTETNIAVTYDDTDNTLDFSVINITGNAATATALQNARTIGGVSFDGTANITLPGVNATGNQDTTGNAATATTLETARTIGGVSFNGSANIDLPGVNTAGNQSTTGNAATATALQNARTIGGTSFDGTANITPANATTAVNVTGTIGSSTTGTTQSAGDNSTKIATTAFVETAISNLIDSSPGALNTLNELAAAIGDDANFSTTITNSIATKLNLSGGTMTGAINLNSNNITNGGTIAGTFSGSGAALTALNASNVSSGTIAAARLGSGTTSSSTYLRGDNTWGTISQYSTPLTTRGDILFRDASGDQRLPAGTSGYFLKTQGSGTDPIWAAVPAGITINNNADNRVITGSGTANTLEGEASLTFDGTTVTSPAISASNGIIETAATVASNHTISTNYNALSAGPVTVSATVTIPSGSVWTIV
jgi:cytoskeletal protein CcmA (bactofilin family)